MKKKFNKLTAYILLHLLSIVYYPFINMYAFKALEKNSDHINK